MSDSDVIQRSPELAPEILRLLEAVGNAAAGEGLDVYAVGGFVRDVVLGRPTTDIDFVSVGPGSGLRLAGAVSKALKGSEPRFYENFGTASVEIPATMSQDVRHLEFVGARTESYRRDSRKPIVEEGTLADDLARRDFTVNAMAFDLSPDRFGALVDPFDGRADLERGLLRTPLDPARTFDDDPLRIIRAGRFAAQLEFRIDPSTLIGMRRHADRQGFRQGRKAHHSRHADGRAQGEYVSERLDRKGGRKRL